MSTICFKILTHTGGDDCGPNMTIGEVLPSVGNFIKTFTKITYWSVSPLSCLVIMKYTICGKCSRPFHIHERQWKWRHLHIFPLQNVKQEKCSSTNFQILSNGSLRCRINRESELALLAVLHREALHEQGCEPRPRPTTKRVEHQESLQSAPGFVKYTIIFRIFRDQSCYTLYEEKYFNPFLYGNACRTFNLDAFWHFVYWN